MGTMNRINKRAELLKKLQEELDHRTQVEKEVVQLIGNCEFEKANDLLATLDDEIVRQIERELDGLHDEKSAENSEDKDLGWAVLTVPEDCKSIFICMDEKMFDERMKNGLIPLYDARNQSIVSVPCFIAYMPTPNLTNKRTVDNLPA